MLDKNSKKILKLLNEMHGNHGCYVMDTIITDCCHIDKMEAELSLNHLKELGLVDDNIRGIHIPHYFYRSTLDGKMYFKNKYFELFMTIFKSVICPIIVSLITTLLTLLLAK